MVGCVLKSFKFSRQEAKAMLDVAVDLHKRFSQVGTLDEYGELRQRRIEHDGMQMEDFLRQLEPHSRIVVEATGTWWWLVDMARELGHEVVISDPKKTKAIASACLKNDRVDVEKLLHLLRLGYLPKVWIPPAPLRYAKEMLRYRHLLVRMRPALKNNLSAMLASGICALRARPCGRWRDARIWDRWA